jgi:hypothetical protein
MIPTDAAYKFDFTIGTNTFSAGLYDLSFYPGGYPAFDPKVHVDILFGMLLIKNGAKWDVLSKTDAMWKDIQSDIGPEHLAKSIINTFNKAIEKYTPGGEMTFNQKIGAIFQLRMALVQNQLVIKPE